MKGFVFLLAIAALAGCSGDPDVRECRPWNEPLDALDRKGAWSRLPGRWVQCGGPKLSNFSGLQIEEDGRWVLLQRLAPGEWSPDFTRTGTLELEDDEGNVRVHLVFEGGERWLTLSITEADRLLLVPATNAEAFHAGMERASDPAETPEGLLEGSGHGEDG